MKKPRFSFSKNRVPRQSSPHVGWFCHVPCDHDWHQKHNFGNFSGFSPHPLKQKFSPYVGFLRHSPPSAALFNEKKKYILKSNRSKKGQDRVAEYFNSMIICSYVSGRLLGGKPKNHKSTLSELVELAFQSAKKEQSNSNFSTEPLDSFEMLNSIATMFLSPIACDDEVSYESRHDEFVEAIKKTMRKFVIPLFHSLIKRVMLGQRNIYGFNHSLGISEFSYQDCVNGSNDKSASSIIKVEDAFELQDSDPIEQEKIDSMNLNSTNTQSKNDKSKPILKSGLLSEPVLEHDGGQSSNDHRNEAGDLEWSWIDISNHVSKESNSDQSRHSEKVQYYSERIEDEKVNPDGTVPSWSFTTLGGSLAGNIFD